MRILIAGGSGLIGTELTKELIKHGHEVIILSRNPQRVVGLPEQVVVEKWDGKTSQGWSSIIEQTCVVVNLVGENLAGEKFFPTRWTDERKKLILQSRLEPGRALVQAIKSAKNKPGVLIQSSAIGYYGPCGEEPIGESRAPGSDFMAKVCVEWENSTADVATLGVRHVVIRTGVVLSLDGGAFTRLLFPFKFFVGGPLGRGKQYLSWIHMSDLIGALRFLIENPDTQGAYNLTAPQPVTNRIFAKTIGKVMGRPSFIPVPAILFKLLFGEVSTVVLDGQRVLPNRLQRLGFEFQFSEIQNAIRDLLEK